MSDDVRLSQQGLKVLRFLMETPREGRSGAEMSKATKVGSGTLYPMLARLEAAGWLTSEWEVIDPSEAGRPRTCSGTMPSICWRRNCPGFP